MTDEEIRMTFLLTILRDIGIHNVDRAFEMARRCTDFVLGKSDAEIIRAAKDLAQKIKGSEKD